MKYIQASDQVEGDPSIKTYFDLIDYLISQTTNALRQSASGTLNKRNGGTC